MLDKEPGSGLGHHFAELIKRLESNGDDIVAEIGTLVVQASENAHVCLPLAGALASLVDQRGDLEVFAERLLTSKFVGRPGDKAPIILDYSNRLYLRRYWQYEQKLARELRQRAVPYANNISLEELGVGLGKLFPQGTDTLSLDWQKIAVAVAFLQKFSIISGGPGTGKTTTVVKLLALLLEMSGAHSLNITLTAPTGKAAARLQESIKKLKGTLDISPAVLAQIPDQVPTIHRLLGYRRNSPYFRHDKCHPLTLDVLVVDEASMIDLALMVKLLEAVPSDSRVVLLGDKDQLASVEAGRVLGDICCKEKNYFSAGFCAILQESATISSDTAVLQKEASSLEDCLVILEKSYRFSNESGIGVLAKAINDSQPVQVRECLQNQNFSDINLVSHGNTDLGTRDEMAELVLNYSGFFDAKTPAEAFLEYNQFRILCVHRYGRFGVEGINAWVEGILASRIRRHDTIWYAGRPIMVTENDYHLGLFNGDTGITMTSKDGTLRVFFIDESGGVRSVAPFRLPAHQTAYAMTVHKSQGAEFEHVVLVLPEKVSSLVGRELLYTAVTRAKKSFTLWGDELVFTKGVERRAIRNSGLSDLLFDCSPQ